MTDLWNQLTGACRPTTVLHLPAEGREVPFADLYRAAERTAGQLSAELPGGDSPRIGLLMANSEPWLRGFMATLRLGGTAFPLPMPTAFGGIQAYVHHLQAIAKDASLDVILVDRSFGKVLRKRVQDELSAVPFLDISEVEGEPVTTPVPVGISGRAAVVQYTSGSTGTPKGVVLTHDNIAAGLLAITETLSWSDSDAIAIWLPLFHDMGLFGTLASLSAGTSVCLWQPRDFVRAPLAWLYAMSKTCATVVPSPNFFYQSLATAAQHEPVPDDLDLSRLRVALNGAEPVRHQTQEEFHRVFAPYGLSAAAPCPTYGLAEATVAVSMCRDGIASRTVWISRDQHRVSDRVAFTDPSAPGARGVVSCGAATHGVRIRIADHDDADLGQGAIGEVQIAGGPVTAGYLNLLPEQQPITADGWLRTGDLGFLLDDELYLTGRLKNMIVVHGENYYAEDVESIFRGVPGAEASRCAAFPLTDTEGAESMVLLWETALEPAEAERLSLAGTDRIKSDLGLSAVEVFPVALQTIPHTSSGKPKRSALRDLCVTQGLLTPSAPTETETPDGHDRPDRLPGRGGRRDRR